MCNPCYICIIACVICFKLNSAWNTQGIRFPKPGETQYPAQGARTLSTPPPTTSKVANLLDRRIYPAPIWPLPPPGEDYDRLVGELLKTYTPFPKTVGTLSSRTPKPPTNSPVYIAPVWPLPPPDVEYERKRTPKAQGVSAKSAFSPAENIPFWERKDPKPSRRMSNKKHNKRSQKKGKEENPETHNTEIDKEATTKWPKVRSRHDTRRDYVRSTRLAPYQLLQDDPTTTKASKIQSAPIMDGTFNQYSMKTDLEIMLRDIDEANVTVEVLTRTVEYNDIVICKITQSKLQSRYFRANEDKYVDEEPEKKIIFIVHGLSAMGFTKVPCLNEKKSFMKLLKYYTAHLDKFDIFLIPIANPDGIGDETLENWNKNKSPQSACLGVALDRNFDVSWNASNSNSCNQQYPGPTPFSELESRAIGDVLHYYSHKIIAYIHVHGGTYDPTIFKGDAVLYPKGFTDVATEDDKYIDIKGEIDEAIRNAGFKVMSVSMETLYNWYGKVHGSSVDFAATIYGVPYAMEFVMQPYEDNLKAEHSDEKISDNVLTEIWKRVIDVVFTNIYKNTHANDVQ